MFIFITHSCENLFQLLLSYTLYFCGHYIHLRTFNYTLVLAQKSMFSLNKKSSFDQNYVFNTALESPQPDAFNRVFVLINGVLEHFPPNKEGKNKIGLNKSFFVRAERVNKVISPILLRQNPLNTFEVSFKYSMIYEDSFLTLVGLS